MLPIRFMLGKHPEKVLADAVYQTEASYELNLNDHSTFLPYFWSTALIMEKSVLKNWKQGDWSPVKLSQLSLSSIFRVPTKYLKMYEDQHLTGFPVKLKPDQVWQPDINTLNSGIQEINMLSMRWNNTRLLKLVEEEKT